MYAALGQGMVLEFVEPGVSRFPAPDDVFLIASILLTTFVVVWPAGRKRPLVLWALLGVALLGLVLSFVRGNWVAFAVGAAYLLVIVRAGERLRLVATLVVAAALLAGGLAVVKPALLDSVATRALAITNTGDPNVQYRLIENRAAAAQIARHPVLGNGLGKDYLFDFSQYGVTPIYKSYIHNNYYWFTQRLGFIGLALFIWTAAAFLLPWLRYRALLDRGDPWITGLIIGSRAMIVVLLAVSITSPRLNSKTSIAIAAVTMGMAEVALGMVRERRTERSLAPGP
jgi:O-antigen ligase